MKAEESLRASTMNDLSGLSSKHENTVGALDCIVDNKAEAVDDIQCTIG